MSLSQCYKLFRFLPVLKNNLLSINNGPVLSNCFITYRQNIRNRCINAKQEVVKDYTDLENKMSKEIFDKVNEQIESKTYGRLFAVVYLQGLQYKVTTEDIIVVRFHWAATAGDKIRLEKVLLVGSNDFTLIGRPILPLDQVSVYGTVIEKTLSHPIPKFKFRPRKNFMKLNFSKDELTYLRITDILLTGKVNELGDTDGLKNKIF